MPVSALQKSQKLAAIRTSITAGTGVAEACAVHGVPRATYARWCDKEKAGGLAALSDGKSTGRPAGLELTADEQRGLTAYCTLLKECEGGLKRWLEQSALPLGERNWPELEVARPETIADLKARLAKVEGTKARPSWPVTVRRAMQVSINLRSQLRGGHELLKVKPSARRAMIWIDEKEQVHAVRPGDIYASDDMSHNEPFRYYDRWLGRETVGRQALLTSDLYSHGIAGQTLIGRRKDSYRVEDIADHVDDIRRRVGMPRVAWRFERGVWDNNYLYGVKAPPSWLLGDDVWGALDGVLFFCRQKFTPRGKGEIERAFREYQKLLYMRSTSLGTIRGEYKLTAKLYRQAIEGNANALRAFWVIADAVEAHTAAIEDYNAAPQKRRAFAYEPHAPAVLWGDSRGADCPRSEEWRFLPIKRFGAVRQGVFECKVEHWPVSFRFLATGTPGCAVLDQGHRVFAAFHPARLDLGCSLFNAEPKEGRSAEYGRKVNKEGFRLMEPLGVAQWWPDTAQENFSATAAEYGMQKQASHALRSEFTSTFGRGSFLARKSRGTDSLGRILAGVPVEDPSADPAAKKPRQSRGPGAASASACAAAGPDLVSLYSRAASARAAAEAELQTADVA